jgi:hypothetical protein
MSNQQQPSLYQAPPQFNPTNYNQQFSTPTPPSPSPSISNVDLQLQAASIQHQQASETPSPLPNQDETTDESQKLLQPVNQLASQLGNIGIKGQIHVDLIHEKRLLQPYDDDKEIPRPKFPHDFYTNVNCHPE